MKSKKVATIPAEETPEPSRPLEPTTFELAQLALHFIAPSAYDSLAFQTAAVRALEVWEAAQKAIEENRVYLHHREQDAEYRKKIPRVTDWPEDAQKQPLIVSYAQGLEWLLPRDRKDRRDALMLEFLQWLRRNSEGDGHQGRDYWRELKKEGFTKHWFSRYAGLIPKWREAKRSAANRENAAKRKGGKSGSPSRP